MDNGKKRRVFVSAAEPSGDAHCANLIRAIRARTEAVEFVGVGGPKMEAAGCRLLANPLHRAAMGHNGFKEAGYFYGLLRLVRQELHADPPDAVVVCDSPSFNFHVAKAAKRQGLRTVFYVAPQLWAWGGWRIGRLRRACDRLCCILPFEPDWFGKRGMEARFVGNPLFDPLPRPLRANIKGYKGYDPNQVRMAIIPGSRSAEIASLWQPMQEIALEIRDEYPGARFTVVAANVERQRELEAAQVPDFTCEYTVDTVHETARQSDFALVASGSATLEVAAAGCPMVAMYRINPHVWKWLGRWLVHPKYFTLVNLVADRWLVPEFVPYFPSTTPITAMVSEFVRDRDNLRQVSHDLVEAVEPLAKRNSSEEVAAIVLDLVGA